MLQVESPTPVRLSGEDLTFWWLDSPMQPTTMAMLMLMDRVPDDRRLRHAFERAVAAVPRLAQRVADAPLDLTLPHWEPDSTFDLDYHVRRHALSGTADMDELLREIAPAYETPFDRSRPLWEARIYDGLGEEHRSALFFKLHHAVADGIGGNAIFAALTDWGREPDDAQECASPPAQPKGQWSEISPIARFMDAVRDRVALDFERAEAVAHTVADTIRHPGRLADALQMVRSLVETATFDSHSPLKSGAGRSRRLTGMDLPFDDVRALKKRLNASMIDVVLTIMTRAIGNWYVERGFREVEELMTLVPINLRKPEEWTDHVNTGNVASALLVPLPIGISDPLRCFEEVRRRVNAKKADPAAAATPLLAEIMSVLPRALLTWMSEASFGSIDFIVTNVPGVPVPRFLAGAEILAAYPFAPVAIKSPVSVALYGYRDRLFIGLNSDEALMPDVAVFQRMILEAFEELRRAATGKRRVVSKPRGRKRK